MDLKNMLDLTIRKTMNREDFTGYHAGYDLWNWIQGVGMYGILKAHDLTGEKEYFSFVSEWAEYHLENGLPEININTTVPMFTVLAMYKETGNPSFRSLCKHYADHIMAEAERTVEGALEHTVLDFSWRQQIWADTLFMGALFCGAWGQFSSEDLYIKEAARQMRLHYKYLKDTESGLLYHGYDSVKDDHLSGIKWGRANGWGLISAIEILDLMPPYFPEVESIKESFRSHIDAILPFQKESGLWCTVVDEADSYEEMTISCCVYYALAMGMSRGYLDESYSESADRAWKGIIANISDDGQFLKTSGPTPVMASFKEYDDVPCTLSYYGQGLGIMALVAGIQRGEKI